jgi:putative PIN family toxin of toxin-antitoxin system
MRVVLDANVLVSAAISRGPSHRIVQTWLQHRPFELVICDRLLGEVRSVLIERPRLRKWISLETAERYITTLTVVADVVPDPASGPALTRDPDDDYAIHCGSCFSPVTHRWSSKRPTAHGCAMNPRIKNPRINLPAR